MKGAAIVFLAAVALYVPTVRYGFVQDDRAIIAENPAVHSLGAAVRAFGSPYWRPPFDAGMYRPTTILSLAVDWMISGGNPGWFHLANALWHGVAAVLVMLLVARWLPPIGAMAAGLVFAVHPVHVEGVASVVGRAELLVAVGVLGAVLAARRGWWLTGLACAALAMLGKEPGAVAGVVILLDNWLQSDVSRKWYPRWFYASVALLTAAYGAIWMMIGRVASPNLAAPFRGAGIEARLAVALPALTRAARLLLWPVDLSVDYSPQVIPAPHGSAAAVFLGVLVALVAPLLVVSLRRRAPAVALGAGVAALTCLPTSNLLFASGVVLAERTLYLAVLPVAAAVGTAAAWGVGHPRVGFRAVTTLVVAISAALGARSVYRLPVWRDNKTRLLVTLAEHPEAYSVQGGAAAVLAAVGDTAGARRHYFIADSLYSGDAYLTAAHAFYLLQLGDTAGVADLLARARGRDAVEPTGRRAQFLLWLRRGDPARARAVADSAVHDVPAESSWYRLPVPRR